MGSFSFPDNYKEDNSGPKFTEDEKDFLSFLLSEHGWVYLDNLPRNEEGQSEWEGNLRHKLTKR